MKVKEGMQRALGVLVIFQALAPFLIVLVLLGGFIKLGCDIGSAVSSHWQNTSQHIQDAGDHIDAIQDEGKRLMAEVVKVKGAAKKFSGDIGKAVEPLRKALLGLQSSMRLVAGSIESVINGVIKAVNKLPRVDIEKLKIKRYFDISAFSINLPEIDLNISPDFTAIHQLARVSEAIATDAQASLVAVRDAFYFWWTLVQWVFILIVLWFVLALVGYGARIYTRVQKGWRLCKGEQFENGLQLL